MERKREREKLRCAPTSDRRSARYVMPSTFDRTKGRSFVCEGCLATTKRYRTVPVAVIQPTTSRRGWLPPPARSCTNQ